MRLDIVLHEQCVCCGACMCECVGRAFSGCNGALLQIEQTLSRVRAKGC
jgi:hypothetical protein